MAYDPFDPKNALLSALGGTPSRNARLDFIERAPPANPYLYLDPTPSSAERHEGLFGALGGLGRPALSSALASLGAPSPLASFGALSGFGSAFTTPPPNPYALPLAPPPKPVAPDTVRRAFFSFHHDDIMRVNNVRQAWKIDHPDSADNRSFKDSSLWEARKLESSDAIKALIREG